MDVFLEKLFVCVLNMSIIASYVILFVIFARLFLKRYPKIFSYGLWSVVLFRLVCPFSFSSMFSFLQIFELDSKKMISIPSNIGTMTQSQANVGISSINSAINSSLPAASSLASCNPMQIILLILSIVWIIGVTALFLYSIISYVNVKRKVCAAILVENNIYEVDSISSPFVLGIINPKIYLPTKIKQTEHSYILTHEQTHIERRDHIIKSVAFLILCVHWFNPLVWISFILMSKDMEMSCDESVLKKLGTDIKRDYTTSLLSLAVKPGRICANPLAFGESNVKTRIKNVLNYKKPHLVIVLILTILCIGVIFVCISNPKADDTSAVETKLLPAQPEWTTQQSLGVDMPVLDYASDNLVIFHGYFGLYVYDLNTLQIVCSLDLKPLKCHGTQGDNACEVAVSMNGNTIQLHPMNSKKMFVYTVSDNKLIETTYKALKDTFKNQIVPTAKVVDSSEAGSYSYNAVAFNTGDYGLLYTSDWTLGSLTYIRDDMLYSLFESIDKNNRNML